MDAHSPCFFERPFRGAFFPTVAPIFITVATALVARIAIIAHYDPGAVVAHVKFQVLRGR
jgi:hypothetical protein